jgi:hypothetical protein
VIWRPVLAGHVTIDAVNRGDVTLDHLLKLNALMDAQQAAEEAASKKGGNS